MSKSAIHYVILPYDTILPQNLQGYFNVASREMLNRTVLYRSNNLYLSMQVDIEQELAQAGYTRFFEEFWLPTVTSDNDREVLVQSLFESIAISYDSIVRPDHNIRCYENLYALAQNQRHSPPIRVLDFGCGTGVITQAQFTNNIPILKGFDTCPKMAAIAKAKGLEVLPIPLQSIHQKETFDIVLASYVFHYGLTSADWRFLLACLAKDGILLGNFHKGIGLKQALKTIENLCDRYSSEVFESPFGSILTVSVIPQEQ